MGRKKNGNGNGHNGHKHNGFFGFKGLNTPFDHLFRDGDRDTSVMAAAKSAKSSRVATKVVFAVMCDGIERHDEDIEAACRGLKYKKSKDVIQHARLALERAGVIVDSGAVKPTIQGGMATVWRFNRPVERSVLQTEEADPNPRRALTKAWNDLADAEAAWAVYLAKVYAMVENAKRNLEEARERGVGVEVAEVRLETHLQNLAEAEKVRG